MEIQVQISRVLSQVVYWQLDTLYYYAILFFLEVTVLWQTKIKLMFQSCALLTFKDAEIHTLQVTDKITSIGKKEQKIEWKYFDNLSLNPQTLLNLTWQLGSLTFFIWYDFPFKVWRGWYFQRKGQFSLYLKLAILYLHLIKGKL